MFEHSNVEVIAPVVFLGLTFFILMLLLCSRKNNKLFESKPPSAGQEPLPEDNFQEEAICAKKPSVDEFERLMIKELERLGSRFKR
jgi:hypothetical protein